MQTRVAIYRNLSLGVTGQVAKDSVGQVYGYYFANRSAAERFVKIYDKATAPAETDTPVMTLPIPAYGVAHRSLPNGLAFSAGISLRATTGLADNDTGVPAANDVVVSLEYK